MVCVSEKELLDQRTAVPTVLLGGIPVSTASRNQLANMVVNDSRTFRESKGKQRPRLMFDVNGHAVSLYYTDVDYRNALDKADLIHADGGFLVAASRRLCKVPIAERSATTDLIRDIAAAGAPEGLSFYLLGASEDNSKAAAETLKRDYPGVKIVGRRNGYFSESALPEIIDDINKLNPDVLWVGLGKPREQIFSVDLQDRVKTSWIITCGGCFDFLSGNARRAPRWMQRANLEWLFRLLMQPRRLFLRYATTSPHALYIILTRRKKSG